MKNLLTLIAFVMLLLHQDFWLWENTNLILGFLPTGLAYHACFSMAVAVLAVLAIRFAWPHDLERWASGEDVESNLKDKKYDIR